jgi:hypothetical protein
MTQALMPPKSHFTTLEFFSVLIISSFGLDYGKNFVLAPEETLFVVQP